MAAAVVANEQSRTALLRLFGAALRTSFLFQSNNSKKTKHLPDVLKAAFALLHTLLVRAPDADPGPQWLQVYDFVHKLLRTQALRVASLRLAALADFFKGNPGSIEDAAQREGRASAGMPKPVRSHTVQLLLIVYHIVCAVETLVAASAKARGCHAAMAVQLGRELAAELHASHALEHAARTWLLVLPRVRDAEGRQDLGAALVAASMAHHAATDLLTQIDSDGNSDTTTTTTTTPDVFTVMSTATASTSDPIAPQQLLRGALAGRCVQTGALVLGLTVLCAADSGPDYGLAGQLGAFVPLDVRLDIDTDEYEALGGNSVEVPWSSNRAMRPTFVQVKGLTSMLRLLTLAGRAPPPGHHGALEVALRVGWVAVVSARLLDPNTAADEEEDEGEGAVQVSTAVSREHLAEVTSDALGAARVLTAARDAQWWEAARLWRLMAAVAGTCALQGASSRQLEAVSSCVAALTSVACTTGVMDLFRMPPIPAGVIAALEGGLLPCLERLLRRAGQSPDGLQALLLAKGFAGVWSYLARLLAYGETRGAEAMVVTMGKLLRLLTDPRVASCAWVLDDGHSGFAAAVGALLLSTASDAVDGQLVTDPQGLSPPSQQLCRVMSHAACVWLPPLSRLIQQAAEATRVEAGERTAPPEAEAAHAARLVRLAALLLRPVLRWVQVLVARCVAPAAGSSRAGAGAGGAGSDAGPAEPAAQPEAAAGAATESDWLWLLLGDINAVLLLGAALELAPLVAGSAAQPLPERLAVLEDLLASCRATVPVYALAAAAEGAGEAAAPLVVPWRPDALRTLAAQLRSLGADASAREADAMAASAERRTGKAGQKAAGPKSNRPRGGENGATPDGTLRFEPLQAPPIAPLLLPPSEARRMLRACAYHGCTNLAGASEAGLRLQACGGCRAVGYCSRACQTQHWRDGHMEACARRRGGG